MISSPTVGDFFTHNGNEVKDLLFVLMDKSATSKSLVLPITSAVNSSELLSLTLTV